VSFKKIKITLKTKLIFLVILGGLFPFLSLSVIMYHQASKTIAKQIINDLDAQSKIKTDYLNTLFNEKEKDIQEIALNYILIDNSEKIVSEFKDDTTTDNYKLLSNRISRTLKHNLNLYDYHDMFIISLYGDIVFSMIHEDEFGTNLNSGKYKDSELAKSFKTAKESSKTVTSKFEYYSPSHKAAAFISTPIYRNNKVVAIFAGQINIDSLYIIVNDTSGLGETGETVIGTNIANVVTVLNPLRHDKNAAFNMKIPIGAKRAHPIQKATQGESGTGTFIDYRHTEVLAAWRYMPKLQLGIVVKQDTSEAYSPVTKLQNWFLIIGLIALTILSYIVWHISKILLRLQEKEEIMIAQSRQAAMGEMIGMIAHQWRQPLSIISMGANNMVVDIELDEINPDSFRKYLDTIMEQIEHLTGTINDFRNFFRQNKDKDSVAIIDVINETLKIVSKSLEHKNIEINIDNKSYIQTEIYSRELLQVFINLINNAKESILNHSKKDGKIYINIYDDLKNITIDICDNGEGLDDKIIDKIFNPYFSTKLEKSGTGLGLYISKTIIEKHLYGTISAHNTDDGACFSINIPNKNEM